MSIQTYYALLEEAMSTWKGCTEVDIEIEMGRLGIYGKDRETVLEKALNDYPGIVYYDALINAAQELGLI